jgi:hypothetical protein
MTSDAVNKSRTERLFVAIGAGAMFSFCHGGGVAGPSRNEHGRCISIGRVVSVHRLMTPSVVNNDAKLVLSGLGVAYINSGCIIGIDFP